jgi:hypothetical protein
MSLESKIFQIGPLLREIWAKEVRGGLSQVTFLEEGKSCF